MRLRVVKWGMKSKSTHSTLLRRSKSLSLCWRQLPETTRDEMLGFGRNKVNSRQLKGEQGQPVPKLSSMVSQFQDGYHQILAFKL